MKNSIKDFVIHNKLVRVAYKSKFYFDLGVAQVSWFTGKLPEIMAFVYLSTWFGFELSRYTMVVFVIGTIFGLVLGGYLWKHLGLYDTECYVRKDKDPITKEIFHASQVIIKEWGKK